MQTKNNNNKNKNKRKDIWNDQRFFRNLGPYQLHKILHVYRYYLDMF